MPSLSELLAQKAALEKKIAETQRQERSAAIMKVRELMSQFGLSAADITRKPAAGKRKGPRAGVKLPPKYRNPATGETWSGRGLHPKWLQSALADGRKKLSDFAV